MNHPQTLSAALCQIYSSLGVSVLTDPAKLSAVFADIAPGLKAERNLIEMLAKSGCLKTLAGAYGSPADSEALIAAATDTLCESYLMDRSKAENLCSTYVEALRGKEYTGATAKPVQPAAERVEEPSTSPFTLKIEDVFAVEGQGTVVTGYVCGSAVRLKETVTLVKKNGQQIPSTVIGIENNHRLLDYAAPGLAVGILLPNVKVADVSRGDTLTAGTPVASSTFQLVVESSFDIFGKGVVVTGFVSGASVHLHDTVSLIKKNGQVLAASVAGIEMFHKLIDRADPGDAVGLLLPGLKSKHIDAGDRLVKR